MTYETDCACGKVIAVKAADAGGTVACACGRSLDVPALSKLRRLDPPPHPPAPPTADYAHLRVPGVVTTLCGVAVNILAGIVFSGAADADAVYVRAAVGMACWVVQVVGTVMVCVSKRFPIFLSVLLTPFGCFGMVVAMLIPERLPPVPPPART